MKNTKIQIQLQLLEMLKSQDINSIKVTQLVDALNISRSTFYLYYDSAFAVLQDTEDVFFEDLQKIANTFWSFPPNSLYLNEPHPIILKAMSYIKEYKEVTKVLWGPYGDSTFKLRCRKMIQHAFFPKHIFQSNLDPAMIYNIAFMTGGHIDIVNCWVDNDCTFDIESLTLLIYKLMYEEYK